MKVLILSTVRFRQNGITSVIMNYFRNMNKNEITFDFAVMESVPEYHDELKKAGAGVFLLPHKSSGYHYLKQLHQVMKNNRYDVVHIHGNSGAMLREVLLAKLNGIHKIIVHCHNTTCDHLLLNQILTPIMNSLSTDFLSCSQESGAWLYGNRSFHVLNNAIDIEKYTFTEEVRREKREELKLKNAFVMGHIGNFIEQKNHSFLIDVFYEFHKIEQNAKLLLIGDGELFEACKAKVEGLGLQDDVIFTGRCPNASELYNAMDIFVLPSKWEGLPLVMVEAQANGLPLLVSDVITEDAKCTDRTFYKPLDHGAEFWAKQIQKIKNQNYGRKADTHSAIAEKGFDICQEAENLRRIYLQ